MVVHNFYVKSIAVCKPEAQTPLLVDSDTPTATAIARELFQSVAGRRLQKPNCLGTVQHDQLPLRLGTEALESPGADSGEQEFRVITAE